jgi:cAMP-dependent protein kinase regulator
MAGDFIISEGEEGHKFYLVEEGEVVATKVFKEGEAATEVAHYGIGDYFGERALLKNEPRAANVVAKTNCKLVTLDRHSFKRLMGPLDEVMRRKMEVYEHFCVNSKAE